MGRIFTPEEIAQIGVQDQQRNVQRRVAGAADAGLASRIGLLARTYTGISPGLAYALASAGIGPGKQAEAIWNKDLGHRMDTLPGIERGVKHKPIHQQAEEIKRNKNIRRRGEQIAAEKQPNRLTAAEQTIQSAHQANPELYPTLAERQEMKAPEGDENFIERGLGIAGKGIELATRPAREHILKPALRNTTTVMQAGAEAEVAMMREAGVPGISLAAKSGPFAPIAAAYDIFGGEDVTEKQTELLLDPTKLPSRLGDIAEQTTAYQHYGRGLSVGSGYFPNPESPAGKAQSKAARENSPYLIGGHAWTPGRAIANTVMEPDDDKAKIISGLIDGYVALKADPADAALVTLSNFRKAKKLVEADIIVEQMKAGVVNKPKYGFLPNAWSTWKDKPRQVKAWEAIAQEDDLVTLYEKTGRKLPKHILLELRDADTPTKVMAVIEKNLVELEKGVSYGGNSAPGKLKSAFKSTSFGEEMTRLNTDVPSPVINIGPGHDIMDAVREADNAAVGIRLPHDMRSSLMDAVIHGDESPQAQRRAIEAIYDAHEYAFIDRGFDATAIREAKLRALEDHAYIQDVNRDVALGEMFGPQTEGVDILDKVYGLADAHTQDLLMNYEIALPDPRMVRRELAKVGNVDLRKITTHKLYQGTQEALDVAMSLWRTSTIARPATGLRIAVDEALRISVDGHQSIISHPMQAILIAAGEPDNSKFLDMLARRAKTAPLVSWIREQEAKGIATHGRNYTVLGGRPIEELIREARYPRLGAVAGSERRVRLRGYTNVGIQDEHAPEALADSIIRHSENPIVRHLLDAGDDLQATKDAFWDGVLKEYRMYMSEGSGLERLATDRHLADAEIDKVVNILKQATAENPQLKEAIRTGMFGGHRIMNGNGMPNRKALDAFKKLIDDEMTNPSKRIAGVNRPARMAAGGADVARPPGYFPAGETLVPPGTYPTSTGHGVQQSMFSDIPAGTGPAQFAPISVPDTFVPMLPETVTASRYKVASQNQRNKVLARMDNTLNLMIDTFLTGPSDRFSRKVLTDQVYLEDMQRTFGHMDRAGRNHLINMMNEPGIGIPKATKRQFEYMHHRISGIEDAYAPVQPVAPNLPTTLGKTPKKVNVDDPLEGLAEDHVRLFRGEVRNPGWDAASESTKARMAETQGSGRWWTTDPGVAKSYGDSKFGGKIHYIDVNADELQKFSRQPQGPHSVPGGHDFAAVSASQRSGTGAGLAGFVAPTAERTTRQVAQPFMTAEGYAAKKAAVGGVPLDETITFDEASMMAARKAVNHTKDLLYDLSKRSQFFDIMHNVMPFGEAWREVITRWSKLTWENPRVVRRFQQGMYAMSAPGSDVINTALGNPATGQGFIYDDQYGEQVFAYPATGWLNSKVFGYNIPLAGKVEGLNLIGNGLPGFGPSVQVPMAYLLPDKPQWDGIRNAINPVGAFGSGDPVQDIADAAMPAFLKKVKDSFFADPSSDRVFASTVFDMAKYLQSTGKYNLHGPEAQSEMNRLMKDAKFKARTLYFIRGMGQATLPSAPNPQWTAFDSGGKLIMAFQATKWYNKRVEAVGYEQAYVDFLDHFGTENFLLSPTIGKTKPTIPAPPTKSNAYDWVRSNPQIRDKYPLVYGLFAPAGGEYSSEALGSALKRHERKQLTPEDMVSSANSRLATISYNKMRTELGPIAGTVVGRALLRDYRAELAQEFPGYLAQPRYFPDKQVMIAQLETAVKDPDLATTKAGRALREYLDERNTILAALGGTGLGAKSNIAFRMQLRDLGDELVDRYPSFQPMWDQVLRSELGTLYGA